MERIYQNHDNYDKSYTSEQFPCIRYYSRKMMKHMYPNHGYIIIGAIGEGLHKKSNQFLYNDIQHDLYNLKYSKFCYGIDGYVDCGNDEYIAVVRNKLPKNISLFVLLLIFIGGLLFGGYMMMGNQITIDPHIGDYNPPVDMPENTDPNRIAIPGFKELTMLVNTNKLYAALWNPETNPCYFKFIIVLEDEDKILFESELVPPGKAITTVNLKETMNKEGKYPVSIKMETYSLEDGKTPMNSGISKTTIHVVKG